MKLKLLPYTRYSEDDLRQKTLNERWIGQGNPDDPFIIKSPHPFSQESAIRDTSLHVIIKNCSFKYLTLNKCKNFTFKGCSFEVLHLLKCSEIKVQDCSFNLRLDLTYSHNIQIHKSSIEFLNIALCYENYFKACQINHILNKFSRANTFENIDTPLQDFNIIMGGKQKKHFFMILGFGIGGIALLLSSIIRFLNAFPDTIIWSLIGGVFLLFAIVLTSVMLNYLNYKKMKEYAPNKFI